MTTRPASFDAKVMSYVPGLRKLAARYATREYRNDLVTDTVIYALEKWENFRGGHESDKGGMWNWLAWCMRGIVKNGATKAATRKKHVLFVPLEDHMQVVTPPNQFEHAYLGQISDRLQSSSTGSALYRRALGDTLEEIGKKHGMCRESARLLVNEGRADLMRRVG